MIKLPWRSTQHQEDDSSRLLHDLLHMPVPEETERLRPVSLRSTTEHRRQTLRHFLLRTWFDHVLRYTERLLVLVLVGFFAFWFIDGYGRDWLHTYQQRQAFIQQAPALVAEANVAAVSATTARLELFYATAPDSTPNDEPIEHTAALPFTPAEGELDIPAPHSAPGPMAPGSAAPGFIAPRAAEVSREWVDPRPTRLVMPSIDIDTSVVEVFVEQGVWQVADYAAGYHHGSALPGEGNTVMAGHAGLRGAVFRDLSALQAGDTIWLEAGRWRYEYRVRHHMNVWPTQVEVVQPTSEPVLTLITCTAWDTKRLVVVAELVDTSPL